VTVQPGTCRRLDKPNGLICIPRSRIPGRARALDARIESLSANTRRSLSVSLSLCLSLCFSFCYIIE